MFWIQDAFLKGDKHLDARKIEQEEERRRAREARRERLYNMGKGNVEVAAAGEQLSEASEDEEGNIVIKKRINRLIEEGMYGKDDLKAKRQGSIIEQHDDLDAVDMDELDRIIEKEKKAER